MNIKIKKFQWIMLWKKLLKKLENKNYTFEFSNKLGIKTIRGPRKLAKEISEKLK